MNKPYTQEQDNWLKKYAPNISYKNLCNLFNKTFGENRTESGIKHRCIRLGSHSVINYQHKYTKEQEQWLLNNYESHPIKETCEKFRQKFGLTLTDLAISIHCCKSLKIKANTCNYYTEEEKQWLIENYPKSEGKQDIYKKYCEHFGKGRSANSISSMCITVLKLKRYTEREKWEMKYGKIPNDCCLTDLGNGEYMVMEKSINHYLSKNKLTKQGEVTKTFYEIIKAQRLIGKATGKSIILNNENCHNIWEWCKRTGYKRKQVKKLNEQDIAKAKELRASGMTYKAIGEIFNVDSCTISNYVNGYGAKKRSFNLL